MAAVMDEGIEMEELRVEKENGMRRMSSSRKMQWSGERIESWLLVTGASPRL